MIYLGSGEKKEIARLRLLENFVENTYYSEDNVSNMQELVTEVVTYNWVDNKENIYFCCLEIDEENNSKHFSEYVLSVKPV